NVTQIPDLSVISQDADWLYIGAAQTITNVMSILAQVAASDPSPNKVKTRAFAALIRHMNDIANVQVRNAASWTGNLMLAKSHPNFPSDLLTILTGVGAYVLVESPTASEWVDVGP